MTKKYPWYTPYQFAGNKPTWAIDLDGLEEISNTVVNNVRFVQLRNVSFDFVIRASTSNLTDQMMNADDPNTNDYSINLQMFEPKPGTNPAYYFAKSPQSDYRSQGLNNKDGKTVEGRSSKQTFYLAVAYNGKVSSGFGDPPVNNKIAFGGGTPMYLNGVKYGETNEYKSDTPDDVPRASKGLVDPENMKWVTQKSNGVYAGQNEATVGKTIVAFDNETKNWLIASQGDGADGMTLDAIRDMLIKGGWDQIVAFDGSNSAALVKDKSIMTKPATYKNNTAAAGLKMSVPLKKKK